MQTSDHKLDPNKSIRAWLLRLAIMAFLLLPTQTGAYKLSLALFIGLTPVLVLPLARTTWVLSAAIFFVCSLGVINFDTVLSLLTSWAQ